MERTTGLGPATSALGGPRSTTELRPQKWLPVWPRSPPLGDPGTGRGSSAGARRSPAGGPLPRACGGPSGRHDSNVRGACSQSRWPATGPHPVLVQRLVGPLVRTGGPADHCGVFAAAGVPSTHPLFFDGRVHVVGLRHWYRQEDSNLRRAWLPSFTGWARWPLRCMSVFGTDDRTRTCKGLAAHWHLKPARLPFRHIRARFAEQPRATERQSSTLATPAHLGAAQGSLVLRCSAGAIRRPPAGSDLRCSSPTRV